MIDTKSFEQIIGYTFKNGKLLDQALTHTSFANESHDRKEYHNERMEFLGDAVLELVSSEFFYQTMPDQTEGEMTKIRASMVCEPTLAYCARLISLDQYIKLGKGEEKTGGRFRDSIISDALESVIGAIYLDSGFANAKEFVLKFILDDIDHKKLFYDSKTALQEIVQNVPGREPVYLMTEVENVDLEHRFHAVVSINQEEYGRGSGRTKKAAQQQAAYQAILKLRERGAGQNVSKKH